MIFVKIQIIQGVPKKCTNRTMDMTWGCLILLSLSKKRRKNTFHAQLVTTYGDWAYAPWPQQHSINHFLGHPVWSSFQFGKSLLFIESKVRLEGAPCVGGARQRECLLPVRRGLNPTPSTVLTATTATGLRTDVWRNKQCLQTLLFEVEIRQNNNIKT